MDMSTNKTTLYRQEEYLKIICKKEEKEMLITILSWRVYCLFNEKYCGPETNCIECIKTKINWEVTNE